MFNFCDFRWKIVILLNFIFLLISALFVFQAKAMVQGRDRRVELGYKLALECRKQVQVSIEAYVFLSSFLCIFISIFSYCFQVFFFWAKNKFTFEYIFAEWNDILNWPCTLSFPPKTFQYFEIQYFNAHRCEFITLLIQIFLNQVYGV